MAEIFPKKRSQGKWLAGCFIVGFIIVAPLVSIFVIFPWLSQQAFHSADELKVEEIEELRVQLLNHPAGKQDIGPIRMDPADFDKLLQPLRNAQPIESIPASAMLGEYRVRYKDGRRGTIRLRFQPANRAIDAAPVWMTIGTQKYQIGNLGTLWPLAEECAARGKK